MKTSALILGLLAAAGDPPLLEKTDLFEAGKGGYVTYRIPGIVATPKGTLLAYCEARHSANDWGAIDILLRRSGDGGKSWGPVQTLVTPDGTVPKNPVALERKSGKEGEPTANNPVAFVDRKTGVLHFLYCIEYARCYYMKSEDEGATWSAPVDITPTFEKLRPDYAWRVVATGPGHGIQLENGRLLVPVWLSTGTIGHGHRPSAVTVVYSDDHGKTWQCGSWVTRDPELTNGSETEAVELADGRVLVNIRNERPEGLRAVSFSKDGATDWTRPVFQKELREPVCFGSLVRLSGVSGRGKSRILFSNPDNAAPPGKGPMALRKNLSVQLSTNEGQTWAVKKTLDPDVSAYSDLAAGPDGTIYCFYERGRLGKDMFNTNFLTVARFNLEWLTEGKDSVEK